MAGFNSSKNKKTAIPQRVKHFIFPEEDEELFKQVEEYNTFATYSLDSGNSTRTILNGLKDINSMMEDPICSSAVKCVMQTAFQSNADDELFKLVSPYTLVENELNDFHRKINAKNIILTTGFNTLLWGQLPWKHIFNEDGVMERVIPIPDFTSVTPIIISGRTIGFMNEEGNFVPSYEYTYSQLEYYKNLGGNSNSRFMTVGTGNSEEVSTLSNEFTYADSYLSAASKPWRNVNIIEDGLLLNRMDQSNYYRIISVNVGGQVYSKSAIQVLNYYRNLFKKVRRVNYDSAGMSSRGNGQEFEVIVPKTQNQGVEINNVGGDMDVRALKDLETQYQKLFAALQLQPSMIGFSSDTPSSLGDSAALTWDKRFAKVCKTVSYSAYNTLRNMDYVHLRSLGFNVDINDWNYATVSQTIQEDADKGETLKLAIENLNQVSDAFTKMDTKYNKEYLVKSVLGDALANYGVDCEKLLASEEDIGEQEEKMITSTKLPPSERHRKFMKDTLTEDAHVMALSGMLDNKTAKEIVSAFSECKLDGVSIKEKVTPLGLKQVYSSFAVKRDNPVDLTNFVIYEDIKPEAMKELFSEIKKAKAGEGVPFRFPIHCSNEFQITAGDLDLAGSGCLNELYIDENNEHYVTSKADLCRYLYNFMNGNYDNYVARLFQK